MSIVNKKPYIVEVLDSLDSSSKVALKNLINGGGEEIFRTLYPNQSSTLSSLDKGIKRVKLEVSGPSTGQRLYNGYLIYTDDYCVLIAYASNKIQTLTLIDMVIGSSPWEFKIKGCELSITELRSELEDASNITIITADDVDSGSATAGYVLTANGSGGATWEEGGSEIEDAEDIPCESADGGNIPVITGDLDQNNHLMYANFRHLFFAQELADSKTTGASLELYSFAYERVVEDEVNYDDGNVICHTSLSENDFMTLVQTCIANMGTTYDLEVYDGFNVSHPVEMVERLYKIYQYKILRLVYNDNNNSVGMYMELDNKDVEFQFLTFDLFGSPVEYLAPAVFKGKIHLYTSTHVDINVILSFEYDSHDDYWRFALRLKATPHTEPNQFDAPEYNTASNYAIGDMCMYLGVLYVCTANTSGTFDDSDWQPTTIAGSVLGLLNTGV